jgi:O-antigen/teichoic acid export membrane protein
VLTALRLFSRLRPHSGRAGWAVAEQGITPLVQLALTPFLLRSLGRDDFGLWVLALTIISMSPLVSLAAGVAATKHVSADLGARNSQQAVAAIRAAVAVALLGGSIAAVLFWVLAPAAAATVFRQMGEPAVVARLLSLCGLAVAVQEIDNVFVGALRGAERFDSCAQIEVPARLAMGCVLFLLGALQVEVCTLLASLTAMMALKAALKGLRVALLFGTAVCCYPSFARAPLRRVAAFGFWQWLQTAGTVFFSAADQLLIGTLLGAAALARYSVCLQIGQYVHLVPSVMMQILFPRLSALGAQVDARRGNEILRSATLAAVALALVIGLPIVLFARPILAIWIGAQFAIANQLLLIVLVAVHMALAFNIAPYFVLLGSGRAARSALIVLAAGAAQFVCAIVVAPLGILAVASSRFVYSLSTGFLYKAARYDSQK